MVGRAAQTYPPAVDPVAERRQRSGQQRQCRREDRQHGQHDPERHGAERGDRHEHDGQQRGDHGEPAREYGLAGRGHRVDRGVARRQAGGERAAEPDHEEQRVVDPERDREHHREVHRPDGHVEELPGDEQQTAGADEPGHRQQERQTGGRQRSEREHEQRERERPGQRLGLHHRGLVGVVEVGPHGGRAGEANGDPGAGQPRRGDPSAVRPPRPSPTAVHPRAR